MCVCACMHACAVTCIQVTGQPAGISSPPLIWNLGFKLRSLGLAVSAFNLLSNLSRPHCLLYITSGTPAHGMVPPTFSTGLRTGCIALERHHDQSNSYKGKHLIGAGLQFQRFSSLSSWWEAWQDKGRHGAGEGAESATS